MDYTFSGVNTETARLAPSEAMQFGRSLHRVLTKIVYANPVYGPVYLAKIDIADGFYRIGLQPRDVPRLGVILPTTDTRDPLVAFPLALPMGWVESPHTSHRSRKPPVTYSTQRCSDGHPHCHTASKH